MTILTVPWDTPYTVGFLPQDPSDVDERPLTVAWVNKTGTVALPYRLADLAVTPGETPTTPVLNPPAATPAPGPPGAVGQPAPPVPAPAPAQVRPAAAPRLRIQSRTNPSIFRRRGIVVRVVLPQAARVRVHLETRVRRRRNGRLRLVTVRLTPQRTLRLRRGTTRLRLAAGANGRRLVGARTRLQATVVTTVRYADGRTVTTRRAARIAPPPSGRR